MATTPATPTVTTVAQTWLQKHERIVIVFLVLLAGGWGYSKYADASASKANTRAQVAEAALASQNATDTKNAATTATVLAQYQAMVATLSAQNASLAAAAAQRQAIVAKNQAQDTTLALPVLAERLGTLGNVPAGQVSTDQNHVILTQPGAVAVTQTLETIPALKSDLADETALATAAQTTQAKGTEVIADQAKQIDGLNLAALDADKVCKAQVAQAKAAGRKSKVRWFKIGFVTGFVSGLWAGHAGL
jgi:hypothetical protein